MSTLNIEVGLFGIAIARLLSNIRTCPGLLRATLTCHLLHKAKRL